jgi:alpha-1,3-rhamnosyltransferase
MLNKPLVSFLIPYYNHKQYVGQTLDSMLSDTYPNKEIIIINDGSTDTDISVINDWVERNNNTLPINFVSRENKGITKTFNELARISKGKYIVFCASDDYLINNTIRDRVSILEKNQEKMVLIADTSVVDGNSETIHKSSIDDWMPYKRSNKENYFSDEGLAYEIINRWTLPGPCSMMNKKLFIESGGYDETLFLEDWDFYLRAAAQKSIIYYDQKVAAYRLHGKNFTSKSTFRLTYSLYLSAKKSYRLFSNPYKKQLFIKKIKLQIQLIIYPIKYISRMIRGKL